MQSLEEYKAFVGGCPRIKMDQQPRAMDFDHNLDYHLYYNSMEFLKMSTQSGLHYYSNSTFKNFRLGTGFGIDTRVLYSPHLLEQNKYPNTIQHICNKNFLPISW